MTGLVELERRCQGLMQEVEAGLMEDKIRLQSKAAGKYDEEIFVELQELEEKKSKETLVFVQKAHFDKVKVKGKERECCRGWEDGERQDEGLMLKTPSPLSHARPPLLVIWKK